MGKDAFSIIPGISLFPGFTELTLESKHSLRAFVWNNLVFCEGFYNEIFCPDYL